MASGGPNPAEKLSVPFGAKEQEIQKFKKEEKEKLKIDEKEADKDIIKEENLDKESDRIAAEIEDAKKVLDPVYADKLTAKLDNIITGAKTELTGKLKTINQGSEKTLKEIYDRTWDRLKGFDGDPEVAVLKLFADKKNDIAQIPEMQIATYKSRSGFYKVINGKLAEKGITENAIKMAQKILGITVDGKVGPQTIMALSKMLMLRSDVKFGNKTINSAKKELDKQGKVVEPKQKKEKAEEPKTTEAPEKPDTPPAAAPPAPEPPPSQPAAPEPEAEAVPEPRREPEPASRRPPEKPEPPKVAAPPAPQPPPEPPKAEPKPKPKPKPEPEPEPEQKTPIPEAAPKEKGAKTPEVTDPQEAKEAEEAEEAEEADKLKADIGLLRKDLEAQKREFTGENLQKSILKKLTTEDTPPEITAAITQKITDAKFDKTMADMIAKTENQLNIADANEDPAAIGLLLGEVKISMKSLTIESFLQTPEVKALTDRLEGPMKKVNELMATISGKEPLGKETQAAQKAIIEATVAFINNNNKKAKFDITSLEKNLHDAIEEEKPPEWIKFDSPEWKKYERAVGATEWHGGLPIFSRDTVIMSNTIKRFTGTILFTNPNWCNACKRIKPFIKQLANEKPEMNLRAKLETGSNQFYDTAGKLHKFRGIPLLVTFKNGHVTKQIQPGEALSAGKKAKEEDVYDKNKVMKNLRSMV